MGRRPPRPLKRSGPKKPERYIIALFCEGAATEPEYFQGLSRLPQVQERTLLDLRIDLTGAVPLTLVRQAIQAKARGTADEYWCIFDVEWPQHHPHLAEAIALAKAKAIPIAVSNPAFELWLLLHFKDHQSHLNTDEAIRDRRSADLSTDKHLDPAKYMPLRAIAAARARNLGKRHASNGSFTPHDNPSSNVFDLVDAIERARPSA